MVGESKAGIHIIKIMGTNVQWQSNKKKMLCSDWQIHIGAGRDD